MKLQITLGNLLVLAALVALLVSWWSPYFHLKYEPTRLVEAHRLTTKITDEYSAICEKHYRVMDEVRRLYREEAISFEAYNEILQVSR